jgi:O-antigen/teichoic acid export membrane protein
MVTAQAVARNISASYLSVVVRALVFLALTPLVVRHLGTTAYAVWILVHTIGFYLRFLDLGLYSALVKYLAEYVTAGCHDGVNDLLANVVGALLIAGLTALLASIAIAAFLVPLFHQVPEDLIPAFQLALVIFGIDLLISFPGSACNGIFEGYQRYDILNYTGIAFLIMQSIGTVALLVLGYGIVSLALLEVASSILGIMVDLWLIRRLFPELRWSVRFFQKGIWSKVRNYSIWSSLNEILVEGAGELDKLLVPFFLSVAMVTPYAIVCMLAALLFVLVEPLTDVVFPMASEYQARRDHDGLRRTLLLATKAALAVTLPAAIVLAAMGGPLIDLWIGREYVQAPPGLLLIVLSSFMVTVFFMPAFSMLAGMARLKEIFYFSIMETVLAVVLVAVSVHQYGLIGLAASCAIANVAVSFGCIFPLACRHLNVHTASYLHEGLMRPLIPAIPAALSAFALTHSGYPGHWGVLALYAGVISAVYLCFFCLLSVSKSERAFVIVRARQLFTGSSETGC